MADTTTDTTKTTTKSKATSTAGRRGSAVSARERARAVMAAKRAAQLERERKIEDALATVLAGTDSETAAATKRDQAIAAAHAAYAQAITEVNARSAQAVRAMRDLDEPITAIAEMTGLPKARITELLKHTDSPTPHDADTPTS